MSVRVAPGGRIRHSFYALELVKRPARGLPRTMVWFAWCNVRPTTLTRVRNSSTRDSVDRDQPVTVELDSGDVGFHDRFSLAGGAGAQDVGQVDLFDGVGADWLRWGGDQVGDELDPVHGHLGCGGRRQPGRMSSMPAPHPAEFRQRAGERARTGDKPVARLANALRIFES